jgi:hypothetical protein
MLECGQKRGRIGMARRSCTPGKIVNKLREAEVLLKGRIPWVKL